MKTRRLLVDSNIIIYAINSASPKHTQAKQFVTGSTDELFVAQQNIFESLRVLTHPKFPNPMNTQSALAAVSSVINRCELITPDITTSFISMELIGKYGIKSNNIFDAYLAATMLTHEIYAIATDNDGDFGIYEAITVINPFT